MNIIQTWLEQRSRTGVSIGAALDELNGALGTHYDHARIGQWRRGERPIPEQVRRYLLSVTLEQAIRDYGGDPPPGREPMRALVRSLLPPKRF